MTITCAYDDIGNRRTSSVNAVPSAYTANGLNQYTAITGGLSRALEYDPDGQQKSAKPKAEPPGDRDFEAVRKHGARSRIRRHSGNCNMTVNGDWLYGWDGENNLWLSQQAVQTNGSLLVENGYDYLKRRWYKRADVLTGYEPPSGNPPMPGEPGEFIPAKTTYFVWDGWNIAAEININEIAGTTNVTRYVWGLDLSGSIQGAGGVGGLLAVIEGDGGVYFPCYDANGNITDYVDINGTVVAHREYGPFGETTVATGPLVHVLHFWFSTKYLDEETGLYYYGYRYYSPELMRFINRDPIGENGGLNLYGFVDNDPLNTVDLFGKGRWSVLVSKRPEHEGEGMSIIVAYELNDSERKCCQQVMIKRWVKKLFGYFGGKKGDFWFDAQYEDMITHAKSPVGRAPDDNPEGPALFGYRLPWTQMFRWEAVCVKGAHAGKSYSVMERRYRSEGHWVGGDFKGDFLP